MADLILSLKDTKTLARFWNKVDKSSGCWIWTGSRDKLKVKKENYGIFFVNGKFYKANRISWMISNGEIPDGLCVLHNCPVRDDKRCVNPEHLYLGTQADNNWDQIKKKQNRPHRGESNPNSKLTAEDIVRIRHLVGVLGRPALEVSKMFGIARQTVDKVIIKETWGHV